MATDAAGSYATLSTQLTANNGYFHVKYLCQVVPGLQHQFSLAATLVPDMITTVACYNSGVILYALHNNYSSSSGVGNNVFSFGSALGSEIVSDSVTGSTIGAFAGSYTGATSGCNVILQGSVPLVGCNLNGDGSTPALVYSAPTVRQVVVVPSGWYGPSGYPDTVVVELALPFTAQPVSNPILNLAFSLMCPNNGTTPITQLLDQPQSSGSSSSNVNIAQVGGNSVISTIPINLAQINGSTVSPTNPLAIVSTGTTKVDVEQVLGSTISPTNPVPILPTSTQGVNITQVLGSTVSNTNPLPTVCSGTQGVNITQVLGATVSSSNPLPTTGGGGGFTGNTPATPLFVRDV